MFDDVTAPHQYNAYASPLRGNRCASGLLPSHHIFSRLLAAQTALRNVAADRRSACAPRCCRNAAAWHKATHRGVAASGRRDSPPTHRAWWRHTFILSLRWRKGAADGWRGAGTHPLRASL